jgi:(1->4)-alpha-D-glucan 1-alpha-D-glucosylmutase
MVLAAAARLPTATYRLQFNRAFTFDDACAVTGYLHALGITDCYASSYLCAVPGSPHGYDVVDPTRLNPDLGTDDDYWKWVNALRARGMGHVLDLVPNHMGIAHAANPWWLDVLENGPSSRYARVFDIEWHPLKAELRNKVLIPTLGDQYGAILEGRELQVRFDRGAFDVYYGADHFPIAPDTYPTIVGDTSDEELTSIMDAARALPPRTTRDPAQIAVRARDKEAVKRRLADLAGRREWVRSLLAARLEELNGAPGDPRSFDDLDRLLGEQSYRLANWRVASEEINYRRFFDVNQLAAVRMEDPDVFEEVHRFVFELVRRGAVTGLRVDHVDGLYAPGDYLRRLHVRIADALGQGASRPFIVVEKILARDEPLPREWPIDGTTGYEFAAVVNGLFVDRRNERAFDDIYRRFIHDRRGGISFPDLAYQCKKLIMHATMSGDINWLGHQLNRFSEHNRHFRDFTAYSLISTLKEVIACFPVYRTYVTSGSPVAERDRQIINEAVQTAKQRSTGIAPEVFDFVGRLLLLERELPTREEVEERSRLVGKFQQITGPVAAKGIEDTALYIYNRLVSLNEVGNDPAVFGIEPAAAHAWMARRRCDWPGALSATATHDTKRGEDVRARINVLSELPGAWKEAVARWRTLNRRFKTALQGRQAPGANEEYLLYQTLVGAWPFENDEDTVRTFKERIAAYMIKALREAKVHTNWLNPAEDYERALGRFIESILDRRAGAAFLQSFVPFQARVARLGIYNSLAQLLIKMTAPGIPDFYQGTELWDLNLVDPDNRRPVNYARRSEILEHFTMPDGAVDVDELFEARTDGRLKMFVTQRTLAERARLHGVYERGDYLPLAASGPRQDCVFAFGRSGDDAVAITCVPRLVATLTPDAAEPPLGRAVWSDTRIELPRAWCERRFRDAFTGATLAVREEGSSFHLAAADVFDRLPIGLLISSGG